MKPGDQKSEGSDPQQRDEALYELERYYRAKLTREDGKNARDIVRGARTRGGANRPTWRAILREVLDYFTLTRLWPRIALGAGALTACLVLLLFLMWSPTVEVHTPTGWQSFSVARLPDKLRFQIGKPSALLAEKQFVLAGNLGGISRGGGTLTTIDATFAGTTRDGTQVTFQGSLVLTNAPGVVNVRSRKDFVGACLKGELSIGTNAPVSYEQPYTSE